MNDLLKQRCELFVKNRDIIKDNFSLGAYGAWNFVMQRPKLFSSIVSIAGGAMLTKYANLINYMPSYIVHGELDR